jgi:serine phosphatase RsbU (regulator of sigma subunit)
VRACAFAGLDPSSTQGVLDRLLAESAAELYATAVVVVYEPEAATLRWSNAGHLPPIVALPGGGARLLDTVHGSLLGVQGEVPYGDSTAPFPPGALLVLYTDGLVEQRGSDIQDSLARLVDAAGGLPLHRSVEALCDRILAAAFAGHNRQDDLCLLLTKRAGETTRPRGE